MKKIFLIAFLIIIVGSQKNLNAQIIPEWIAKHSIFIPGQISSNDLIIDNQGNSYVVGSFGDTTGYTETIVLKYNQTGVLQYYNTIDSTYYFNQGAIDDSSNLYIAGTKYSNGSHIFLVKYDSFGNFQWERQFSIGTSWNWGYDIVVDDSANAIIGGITKGNLFTTLKYDYNGNLLWSAFDSSAYGTSFSYIDVDENCNIYYAGRAHDSTYKANIYMYNSSGIKQWQASYPGNIQPGHASPSNIVYKNGNVYLLAATNYGSGNGDCVVIKYDMAGTFKWEGVYSAIPYYDIPEGIDIDNWDNVYLTAYIYPWNCSDAIATTRFDSSGSLKWTNVFTSGSCSDDRPHDIEVDSSGYIYVTGVSPDSLNQENYFLVKYDSLGNELWVASYKDTTIYNNISYCIKLDVFGNIFITGITLSPSSDNFVTLKYGLTTGLHTVNHTSDPFYLYPNPFMNKIQLQTKVTMPDVILKLFDLTGREIIELKVDDQNSFQVNRDYLRQGIYIYKLFEKGNYISSGKLIAE